MRKLRIGILGTRGIPNAYGGFEQFAEYLSHGLVERGHEVWVYNSDQHPYKENSYKGVHIIHCKDWEHRIGTAGQFIYDYNCFSDARRRNFDILLQLGYTSSSVWVKRWPNRAINIVNMDGLEWKRSKYGKLTQKFLKWAEGLAAKNADKLIADSIGIQQYLLSEYNKPSVYIPYGAENITNEDRSALLKYGLKSGAYYLLIARMEPENNIEMIITGYLTSKSDHPLIMVGSTSNKFGSMLQSRYGNENVRFVGACYDQQMINSLRQHALLYFHGHSVGGTNPSLLEAMACGCPVAAHGNVFNKAILGPDAAYFESATDIKSIIETGRSKDETTKATGANRNKISTLYSWKTIIDAYELVFMDSLPSA